MVTARRRGPGALLRRLSGAQQQVLDLVPGEQSRYTSMGGVVLCTALIATISMATALSAVFGTVAHPAVLVLAALWGVFVLNLDRWLMSVVIDARGYARLLRFLPRIVMAVMFGVVIAEPLLVGIFGTAIEQRIRDERAADLRAYEEQLTRCNPPDGPAARPADCAAGLNIATNPDAARDDLDRARGRAEQLRREATREQERYDGLTDLANRECGGESGPGLTGRPGAGPECLRLDRAAARFRRQSGLDADRVELARLDGEVDRLGDLLRTTGATYAATVAQRITGLVAERRSAQRDIGLLERFRAMSTLVSADPYVHATQWALRIFFIVVDALPVLIKLLNGTTAYDRIALTRLARQERAQQLVEGTEGYRATVDAGVQRYGIDLSAAAARERASVQAADAYRQHTGRHHGARNGRPAPDGYQGVSAGEPR